MIYSNDMDKKCAVCVFSEKRGNDLYCSKKKRTFSVTENACDKFSYDILKRNVRRPKRIETHFDPEDFSL